MVDGMEDFGAEACKTLTADSGPKSGPYKEFWCGQWPQALRR